MKYSIVVPVYNVESYLETCIASVLGQTYQNYELVLVDDGSTDRSSMLCDFYAQQYPGKVMAFHKTNGGALAARQYGVSCASGDVIMFLDSDDGLRRDALAQIEKVFIQEHCDMVLFNASWEPDFSPSYFLHPFANGVSFEGDSKAELYDFMTLSSSLNSLCIKAVRKEITDTLPDFTQLPRVVNGEDLLCSLPLVTNAKKIVYLQQNLYYYRQRPDSTVHSFNPTRGSSIKTVHQEFERYIDIWQMPQLHAKHYAREVRGWVETLELLVANRRRMTHNDFRSALDTLSEDSYFRNAYAKMDASLLSKRTHFLAKCLHQKKYTPILLLGELRSIRRSVRRMIK